MNEAIDTSTPAQLRQAAEALACLGYSAESELLCPTEPSALPSDLPRTLWIASVLSFVGMLTWFVVGSTRMVVTSSADYSATLGPAHLVDGDPTTDWLLPDGQTGFIDIALPVRRAVKRVTLVNGRNEPFRDRGAKNVRIVVLDDLAEVDAADVVFSEIGDLTEREVSMAGKQGTRVRLYVEGHIGLGAALAEADVD